MRPRHLAVLVALSVIWGSAFMLVKVVLEEVDALTLVAGRLVGGFLVLAAVLLVTKRRLPMTRQAWLVCIALGLGNNVWPFILLTWGQERIESSLAAIRRRHGANRMAHPDQERLTLDRQAAGASRACRPDRQA
jgi:drug/metabolite transporter (DMT)-like permease